MGLLGKIGHFIGHNLSEASHAAGIIPGIGPVVGAGMRAAGGLIEGDGIHDSLKNAAVEGVKNYGIGKIASHIPGVSSITDKLGQIPGLGSAAQAAAGGSGGGGEGGGGIMDRVGSFLGGNGGMNALGLAQGANAAYLGKKAGDYAGDALDSVKGAYDANAPLRTQGRQQMLNPGQGIQARIAAIPQGANVYAQHPQTPTLGPVGNAFQRHSTGGPV